MSFQYNSATANVTIDGGITTDGMLSPSTGQTIVTYTTGYGTANFGDGTTIFTPTSGKTFFLTSIIVGTGTAAFEIRDNTVGKIGLPNGGSWLGLPSPVAFTGALKTGKASTTSIQLTLIGFEETTP